MPRHDTSGARRSDPLDAAARWLETDGRVALATVVSTWGSAPLRPGSQMCVSVDGEMEGSVSGGCVEGAVVHEAQALLEGGGRTLLSFGVSDDEAWAVGLACGGRIEVFVESIQDPGWMADVRGARAEGRTVVVAHDLDSGKRAVLFPLDEAGSESAPPSPAGAASTDLLAAASKAAEADRSGRWEGPDGTLFLQVFNPPVRVLVVGAVHIAQPLTVMAREAGFAVTVIDPREAFATPGRFPGTHVVRNWPSEALAELGIDHRTAVVTVTHDPKLDDPALRAALASQAFYVGALGSRRTHGKRVRRLEEAGFGGEDIARIRAPVGLDIGARTPGEIAASVLAEIVAVLRRGQA